MDDSQLDRFIHRFAVKLWVCNVELRQKIHRRVNKDE